MILRKNRLFFKYAKLLAFVMKTGFVLCEVQIRIDYEVKFVMSSGVLCKVRDEK
jgi:hypothetical protein